MAGMEGRRPYRIYDPGGGTEENGSTAFERLVEENTRLKEKMQGIKSIGNCWGEDEVHLWGSLGCSHGAWGFLAVSRKGAVRRWGFGTGAVAELSPSWGLSSVFGLFHTGL